jgi:hypothetical protein
MANWIILTVGKQEVASWAWSLPESDKAIIRFIFTKADLQVVEDEEYTCVIKTTVSKAKKRFDRFGFTLSEMDRIICDLIDVSLDKIELALMNDDEFFDTYPEPDFEEKTHSKWEALFNEKSEIDKRKDKTNLGHLPVLRKIRKTLDDSNNDENVKLLYEYDPEDISIESLALFPENYTSTMMIQRKYLESAKAHITTEDFDLAYIEMIIALESAIKAFIAKKSKRPVNLESIVKDLSLIDLIIFGMVFLGGKSVNQSAVKSLNKAYNIRNTIIHRGAKNFRVSDIIESMHTVEYFIKTIESIQ